MVSDRAYLKGARSGAALARLRAEIDRIMRGLTATGAVLVEPEALQPAELLLDLYGEDIRARAYTTADESGERMLRPDFTVPVVRMHMEAGGAPAAYAYCGPVWRRQEAGSARPAEYLQAGIELFDAGDPAAADAEVFARVAEAIGPAPVAPVIGDMGLILAAIDGLETSAARRAALRRHVWRPAAFHRMLERFGAEHAAVCAARAELLADRAAGRLPERIAAAGAPVGLRTVADIEGRAARLAAEAETPPLTAAQVAGLEAVLAVKGTAAEALARFRALALELPGLAAAVERLAARLAALAARGHPAAALRFEAGFGRTTLEYYDGFVFGFVADRPDLPPIASGGRYDALTRVLGGGAGIPAVGGMIRPEALMALGPC